MRQELADLTVGEMVATLVDGAEVVSVVAIAAVVAPAAAAGAAAEAVVVAAVVAAEAQEPLVGNEILVLWV